MTVQEKIELVIDKYYRGLVSYGDCEKYILQIAPYLDEGDVGVMVFG